MKTSLTYNHSPSAKFLSGSAENMKEMIDIVLEKEKRRVETLTLLKESTALLGVVCVDIDKAFTVLGSLLGCIDTKLSFYDRYTNRVIEKSILEFAVSDIDAEIKAISSGVDRIKNSNDDNDRKLEVKVLFHSCEKVLNKFEDRKHIFYKHPLVTTPYLIAFSQLYLSIIEVGTILMSTCNDYNDEKRKIKKVIEEYKVNTIKDRIEMIKIMKTSKRIGYDSHMIKDSVTTYFASRDLSESVKQLTENDFIRDVDELKDALLNEEKPERVYTWDHAVWDKRQGSKQNNNYADVVRIEYEKFFDKFINHIQ